MPLPGAAREAIPFLNSNFFTASPLRAGRIRVFLDGDLCLSPVPSRFPHPALTGVQNLPYYRRRKERCQTRGNVGQSHRRVVGKSFKRIEFLFRDKAAEYDFRQVLLPRDHAEAVDIRGEVNFDNSINLRGRAAGRPGDCTTPFKPRHPVL